jgi:hypothetical protein
MIEFIPPRLRKPAAITLAGLVFAAAWLIRGGPLWWVSIMAVVVTAVRAISWYLMGGKDTDEGALAGSRGDERQQMVSLQSRALGFNVAGIAAFIGLTAGVAANAAWWWPFAAMLTLIGFGYLFGLSSYGSGESDADSSYYPSPSARR